MTKKTLFIVGGFALMLALFMGGLVTAHDEAATLSSESPAGQIHIQAEALAQELVQAARGINLVQTLRETSQRLRLTELLEQQEVETPLASLMALNEVADTVLSTIPAPEGFTSEFMTNLNSALNQFDPLQVFSVPLPLFEEWGRERAEFLRADSFEIPMLLPAIP